MLRDFIRAVFAGIMIGIGGRVYLSADNKIAGAVLFSVGLISVLIFGMNLYTGRVGYISSLRDIPGCLVSIAGNAVGCLIAAILPHKNAAAAAAARLDASFFELFVKGFFCGILIYIAVDFYKTQKKLIAALFCVPAFIIAGFEHSVADMYYLFAARVFSLRGCAVILTVILGNAAGALAFNAFKKYCVLPKSE